MPNLKIYSFPKKNSVKEFSACTHGSQGTPEKEFLAITHGTLGIPRRLSDGLANQSFYRSDISRVQLKSD